MNEKSKAELLREANIWAGVREDYSSASDECHIVMHALSKLLDEDALKKCPATSAIKTFIEENDRLKLIANNPSASIKERIQALCELYRWNQGDVHNQARFINQIEDLTKEL